MAPPIDNPLPQAGFLAQKRLARGVRLNYPGACMLMPCKRGGLPAHHTGLAPHHLIHHPHPPTEAVALIAAVLMEMARDGERSVAELMDLGRHLLGHRQVQTD